jgi:hypothetical protein
VLGTLYVSSFKLYNITSRKAHFAKEKLRLGDVRYLAHGVVKLGGKRRPVCLSSLFSEQ